MDHNMPCKCKLEDQCFFCTPGTPFPDGQYTHPQKSMVSIGFFIIDSVYIFHVFHL